MTPCPKQTIAPHVTKQFLKAAPIIWLAMKGALSLVGGQNYWPDEVRLEQARNLVVQLIQEGPSLSLVSRSITPEHAIFKILSVPFLLLDHLFNTGDTFVVLGFVLFSWASCLLLHDVIRRAGGSEYGATFGVFMYVTSNSMLYYSRHFLPYDLAFFFFLASLHKALQRNIRGYFLSGFFAGLSFFTYNGYWILTIPPLLLPLRGITKNSHKVFMILSYSKLFFLYFFGGVSAVILFVVFWNFNYIYIFKTFTVFSGTVTQGAFGEGWLQVIGYFAAAESFLPILWVACLLGAVFSRRRNVAMPWIIILLFMLLSMLAASDIFHMFVIYGRTARMLIIPLCISVGLFFSTRRIFVRWAAPAALAGLVLALPNIWQSFSLDFPREFYARNVRTFELALPKPAPVFGYSLPQCEEYHQAPSTPPAPVFCGLKYFYPLSCPCMDEKYIGLTAAARAMHPVMHPPYLFEGFTAAERESLRRQPQEMVLYIPTALLMHQK